MTQTFRRHGDVNFHPVDTVHGTKVPHHGSYIVARGEATGSTHTLTVSNPKDMVITETENGTRYVELFREAILTHTHDHEPVTLEPGRYVQVPEREVDHFQHVIRNVID